MPPAAGRAPWADRQDDWFCTRHRGITKHDGDGVHEAAPVTERAARRQQQERWVARLARSGLCAALGGFGAALLDAGWARGAGTPSLSALLLADAGLVAPIALCLAAAAAALALMLDPAHPPSP